MGAKAVPHLAQYLSDDNEDLSGSILDIIGEINDPGSASLVLRFMDQTASVELLCDSIKILGNLKHAGAVTKLVSTLNDSPETLFFAKDIQNVALATIWALGEIGSKSAVPHLLQFAKSNNKVIYLTAVADALGKINDARSLPFLLDQLKHRDTSVRVNAARALGSFTGKELFKPLWAAFENETEYEVRSALLDPLVDSGGTAAIERFVGMLKSGQPFTVQVLGERALKKIGVKSVPALIAALDQKDRELRIGSIRILSTLAPTEAMPQLTNLAGEKDKIVRIAAIEALGRCGDQSSVLFLKRLSLSLDKSTRKAARTAREKISERLALGENIAK